MGPSLVMKEVGEMLLRRLVFAAMVDLRTHDGRHVLHYSESRWNHGVLRFSPFGGGLQVSEKGKKVVDALGEVSWLGRGDDALDLRVMVPASLTSEVVEWFSTADASLREHAEGASLGIPGILISRHLNIHLGCHSKRSF